MKIGFVVSFFDFRNDVRRVIAEVASQHQVVVFGKVQDADAIQRHLPDGVEFRLIRERKDSYLNFLWERIFLLFRAIPSSRHNFFLMELLKASNTTDAGRRRKAYRLLRWMQWLPKVVPYDTYLNRLQIRQETQIADVDQFIFFTAIADDYLLARLIRERHPQVKVYVYSWDHPCKHTCFSRRTQYLVWTEAIRQDVVRLQGVPAGQVRIVGASQFCYLYEFSEKQKSSLPRSYPFPYLYMGCAIGIGDLAPDEVQVAYRIASYMATARPDLKVVIRPYPQQANWALYNQLQSLPNVVMDDEYRNSDLSVRERHIIEKYEKMYHAEAFLHLGTTMGLEACLTGTPSFILDFGYTEQSGLSLYNFIHQYQNDRHLIELAPQNAIRSEQHLAEIFSKLDRSSYLLLNEKVQKQYLLKSFGQFADDIVRA